MKKFLLVAVISLLTLPSFLSHANTNLTFNSIGMTYDSLVIYITDTKIPLDTKFALVREILEVQPSKEIQHVYNVVLQQSKKQENAKYSIDLYCAIANSNMQIEGKLPIAKLYLDSAFILEKKTTDLSSLALMNFMMSRYYSTIKQEDKAHEYLYKTIGYFEKTEGKKSTAILLLYNLSEGYYKHKDFDSLKKNMTRMLTLAKEVNEGSSYVLTYNVAVTYYNLLYREKLANEAYLDSIISYNNKTLNIFNQSDEVTQTTIIGLVTQSVLNTSECMTLSPNANWKQIDVFLNLIDKQGAYDAIGSVDNRIIYHQVKAKSFLNKKEYDKALNESLTALNITENELNGKELHTYLYVYNLLSEIYEQKGDYKNALKYSRLIDKVKVEMNEISKYEVIKELESRYETAKKELEISKLNEEKQQTQYRITIIVAGLICVAVLLMIGLLYNRMKRLKKEKEIAVMAEQIKDKDAEYQSLLKDTNLKQMNQYLKGLEAERTRLAKELHDNVSNELLAIKMQINSKNDIEQATNSLSELHEKVRGISHDLMPPVFQYASLSEILTDYVHSLNNISGTYFTLGIKNTDLIERTPHKSALEIYRVIQEASGNILKHAQAHNAEIHLDADEANISLSINDNGKGFDVASKKKGIGLQIIRDRVQSMEGSFSVKSTQGKGCSISLTIPHQQSVEE